MAMADVDTSSSPLSLDSEEHIMMDDMMDIPIPGSELLCLKNLGAGLEFGGCLALILQYHM